MVYREEILHYESSEAFIETVDIPSLEMFNARLDGF